MLALLLSALMAAAPAPADEVKEPEKNPAAAVSVSAVKKELGSGCLVEKVGPYLVAGNMDRRWFESLKGTVSSSFEEFYKQFFETKPKGPIPVYLFKDAASYKDYCKKRFGRAPSTPYGFYSDGCLVMNAATGGGTLVHELVHTMVNSDFPAIPSWFNEGFASLYEQCELKPKIKGLVNWRLPGLQNAIKDNSFIPLKKLIATTTEQFYGRDSGLHYAEARYLCMYLQENGRLEKFYTDFRKEAAKDPSGIETLEKVTGKKVDELEAAFKPWASTLKWK